jgi:hypothetical protein
MTAIKITNGKEMKTPQFITPKKLTPEQQKISDMLSNAEDRKKIILSWHDHIEQCHIIKNYSTIIGEKIYLIQAKETEILIPYMENLGDHGESFILMLDRTTGNELHRKNTRTVDLIEWELSSFQNDFQTKTEE